MKYFLLLMTALMGTAFLAGCGGGGPGTPGMGVATDFLEYAAAGEDEDAEELLYPLKKFRFDNGLERNKFDEAVEDLEEEFDEDEEFTLIDYDVSEDGRNASYTFAYDDNEKKVTVILKEFEGKMMVNDIR
ncbi:MAG: hypothetical protein ACFB20_04905 [Opitutales bacterium]